jgi:hypothetical protein
MGDYIDSVRRHGARTRLPDGVHEADPGDGKAFPPGPWRSAVPEGSVMSPECAGSRSGG